MGKRRKSIPESSSSCIHGALGQLFSSGWWTSFLAQPKAILQLLPKVKQSLRFWESTNKWDGCSCTHSAWHPSLRTKTQEYALKRTNSETEVIILTKYQPILHVEGKLWSEYVWMNVWCSEDLQKKRRYSCSELRSGCGALRWKANMLALPEDH